MISPVRKALPRGAALLTALCLTTAAIPPADAASSTSPKLSMQSAEKIVETLFQIPKKYQLQNESYNQNNYGTAPASYSFSWQDTSTNNTGGNGGYISASVDANTGFILNYNRSSQNNQFEFPVPVNPQKAEQLAKKWLQEVYPAEAASVKVLPLAPQFGSLRNPVSYTFNFERVVNGIPAPFDGMSITLDENGKLTGLGANWTNLTFPGASSAVALSTANGTYKNALALQLVYGSVWHQNSKPTTALMYNPVSDVSGWWNTQYGGMQVSSPVINAATGKVIDALGKQPKVAPVPVLKPLVPGGPNKPLKKVNWTEAQAESYARTVAGITSTEKLRNVNQWQSSGSDTTYNFSWVGPKNLNINVGVDGTYGFMSNFNSYQSGPIPSGSGTKSSGTATKPPKPTQDEVLQTVQEFLKRVYPNLVGALALQPSQTPSNPKTVVTSYQIVPLVNGIPDTTQSGSINVNGNTGAIQNLWMNFQPQAATSYPAAKNAVSVSEAKQDWIAERPLTLEYLETIPPNSPMAMKMALVASGSTSVSSTASTASGTSAGSSSSSTSSSSASSSKSAKSASVNGPQVILAYAPSISSTSSSYFDATTGKFESTDATATPYTGPINDITGNPAAAQLQLLAERELISVDSHGNVHPNQQLTNGAFVKLLVDALGQQYIYNAQSASTLATNAAAMKVIGSVSTTSPTYPEIVSAYQLGWLPIGVAFKPNAPLTRGLAAQILVSALGYGALENHPEAFKLSAKDASSIRQSQYAAAALSVALKLFPLDASSDFAPTSRVTLSDAAVAVVQAATLLPNGGGPIRY